MQQHPDSVIEYPNQDKPEAKATKAAVVGLMLISVGVMAIVTIGGWNTLQGAKPVQVFYIAIYVVIAYYIGRWRSGMLPVAAALAVILLILAAIAGPQWFARNHPGFTNPPIDESILGILTLALVPVQVLLILFASRGFAQKWSVEVEHRAPGSLGGARAAV